MGVLGFPTENELADLFGVVTPEDRAKWAQYEEATRPEAFAARRRNGASAAELGSTSAAPALGMLEQSIHAQMQGEQMALRGREHTMAEDEVKVTETRTRTKYVPHDDGPSSGGGNEGMGF